MDSIISEVGPFAYFVGVLNVPISLKNNFNASVILVRLRVRRAMWRYWSNPISKSEVVAKHLMTGATRSIETLNRLLIHLVTLIFSYFCTMWARWDFYLTPTSSFCFSLLLTLRAVESLKKKRSSLIEFECLPFRRVTSRTPTSVTLVSDGGTSRCSNIKWQASYYWGGVSVLFDLVSLPCSLSFPSNIRLFFFPSLSSSR